MKHSRLVAVAMIGFSVLALTGCGSGDKIKTVKVSGTVKLDGNALDSAEINFMGPKYAGIATTDTSGKFELEAQPGENTIYIRKFEGAGPEFDETMVDSSDTGEGSAGGKQLVPAKFSDPAKTELKFTVPDDGTESADFDLQSK